MFDIYYNGNIVDGEKLDNVKTNVQRLFNAGEQKMAMLFSGEPCPVKLGVDNATAEKYKHAMLKAGAIAMVLPAGEEPEYSNNPFSASATKANPESSESSTTSKKQHTHSDNNPAQSATIADVGEGFLAEQPEFIERKFDFSEYSVASTGSQIDTDATELPVTPPNTDHLSLQ